MDIEERVIQTPNFQSGSAISHKEFQQWCSKDGNTTHQSPISSHVTTNI